MDLNTISFCDKVGYNVCSDTAKQTIMDELHEKYGVNLAERSVRLYEPSRHKILLQRHPYFVSLKSIGNTYLLYLTQWRGVPLAFMIDKKVLRGYSLPRIIMVRYRFSEELYCGTLMEGDLVRCRETTQWKFVLSDLWVNAGVDQREGPFTLRIQQLQKLLEEKYQRDPIAEPTGLFIKQYRPYTSEGIETLREAMRHTNYQIQGLCFTQARVWKPSLLVTDRSSDTQVSEARRLAKQARSHKHVGSTPTVVSTKSVDFVESVETGKTAQVELKITHETPNIESTTPRFHLLIGKGATTGLYQLYCNKMGKVIKHSIARIDGLVCLRLVRKLLGTQDRVMVACEYQPEFEKFTPKSSSTRSVPDEYTEILDFTGKRI